MMKNYLRKASWQFILKQGIDSLPVDPFRLAFQMELYVLTYQQYAVIVQKSVEDIIQQYDKDGFSFWSEAESCFIICYNNLIPFPVCRWTLVHEIAHIYLGHISHSNPVLKRVRTPERSLFEAEAQGFARRVLCPSIVLHDCHAFETEEIMNLCGISYEAASYRSQYTKKLEERDQFLADPLEILVETQFEKFIKYYLRSRHLQNPL